MYLRVHGSRDSSRKSPPSPSLCSSLTYVHRFIGYRNRNPQPLTKSTTRLILTITWTQVLCFLERLTWTTVSCYVTTSTRLTVCTQCMWDVLDPPVSVFSLSLYRHPCLYPLFSSRFTLIINNNSLFSVAWVFSKELGSWHGDVTHGETEYYFWLTVKTHERVLIFWSGHKMTKILKWNTGTWIENPWRGLHFYDKLTYELFKTVKFTFFGSRDYIVT
jgi:hypothetical protein